MPGIKSVTETVRGLGEKVVGLNLEVAGTIFRNDRLREGGRHLGAAGDERLSAGREDTKAAGRQAEAKVHEREQQAHQSGSTRSAKSPGTDPSARRAAAESAKGAVKQAAGKVIGSDDLEDEGREQRERGSDESAAVKHETKADIHRKKAGTHRQAAERVLDGENG